MMVYWDKLGYRRTIFGIRPVVCLPFTTPATKVDGVWTVTP